MSASRQSSRFHSQVPPQPKVTWQYNGQTPLPDPKRTTAETIYNMTALTLSRVKRSDAGTYSLILDNPSGKATLSVKVKVIGKVA
jgi:hypothetical protein